MHPIGNQRFMEHVILALAANDVLDLYVLAGYKKEKVLDHFEGGVDFGVPKKAATRTKKSSKTSKKMEKGDTHARGR